MPIAVTCPGCRAPFRLKDDFAGQTVRCPKCSEVIQVPGPEDHELAATTNEPSGLHASFQRDKFLLRQKAMSINQKYFVWDDHGQTILFIERPSFVAKTMLALFAMFAIIFGTIIGGIAVLSVLEKQMSKDVLVPLFILGIICSFVLGFVVLFLLVPKRHIHFYSGEDKAEQLLHISQDNKLMFPSAWYTLRDSQGSILARFKKNYLYNIFRKRWYVFGPEQNPHIIAIEDSFLLSLLRRFLGPMFGLLRTNYVIHRYDEGRQGDLVGEFNRKFTLLDRYVLDLGADPSRTIDRRVALALGVLLDTGEQR